MVKKSIKRFKDSKIQRLKILLIFLIFPIFQSFNSLHSYTRLGYNNLGDVVSGHSARSVGMGSTEITTADDSSALIVNPAAILNTTAKRALLSLTPSYILYGEKENVSNVSDNSVYFQPTCLGASVPVIAGRLVAGVNYSPVLDFSYKYSYTALLPETMEKNYDSDVVASGGMKETSLGFGLKIAEGISAGFSYGIIGGEDDVDYEYTYYNNNRINWIYKLDVSREYEGDCLKYGLLFEKGAYRLGMFYQPSSVIERKWTQTITDYNLTSANVWTSSGAVYNEEFRYPEKFGAGFSYSFKDRMRSLLAVDWARQNWNVTTYRVVSVNGSPTGNRREKIPGYEKTDEIKIGIEMWLNDWIPVRCGFRYQEFYDTWDKWVYYWYHNSWIKHKEIPALYCFSLGSGYVLSYFDVNFGYEFGRRSYETELFSRYDETVQRLVLTVRRRW